MSNEFKGFPKEIIDFYKNLTENNNVQWFNENKPVYEKYVLNPSRHFVVSLGDRLQEISRDLNAIPKVNKSIFRIYRDTRFSKDKRPYQTNLGIIFWEGIRHKRLECPGFYFHLEYNMFFLGSGLYIFPKDVLTQYRDIVSNKQKAAELNNILRQLTDRGCKTQETSYKRIPAGYQAIQENEELLRYNGLSAMCRYDINEILFSGKIIDFCLEKFKLMAPLHYWLINNIN